MKKLIALLLCFSFLLLSCADSEDDKKSDNAKYYLSKGYGWLVKIDGEDFTSYNVAGKKYYKQDSNFEIDRLKIKNGKELYDFYGDKVGEFSDCVYSDGQVNYDFEQIDSIDDYELEEGDDAAAVFECFWQTIEENSAVMRVSGADWSALYDEYKPKVSSRMSDEDLFTLLSEMTAKLKDGHMNVGITSDGNIIEAFCGAPEDEFRDFNDDNRSAMIDIVSKQLTDYDESRVLKTDEGVRLQYGMLGDSIGYIGLHTFESVESESTCYQEELAAYIAVLDSVSAYFESKQISKFIVDLRFNGGGYDTFAVETAKYFAAAKYDAYSKAARCGGYEDFLPVQVITVEPKQNWLSGKTALVLTGTATYSAAEVGAMVFKGMGDNATLAGSHTAGFFSDLLIKSLPNGWVFTLSNERYFDAEGTNPEQKGIEPDIAISYDYALFESGRDSVLEQAVTTIKNM